MEVVAEQRPSRRLTRGELEELGSSTREDLSPAAARRLVVRLETLGRWILHPGVFHRATIQSRGLAPISALPQGWINPPRPPRSVGSCPVLLVDDAAGDASLLRPCFVLPLSWRGDTGHSPGLPRNLAALADRVIDVLRPEPRVQARRWGLHLSGQGGLDRWDLSDLPMDCRSAWAPLAAGLILAADQIIPEPGVWGTGEWNPAGGIVAVGGLDRKLALALEFAARTIFIPSGQRASAEEWKSSHPGAAIEIAALDPTEKPDLRIALRTFVARSSSRPEPAADFEVRKNYYLRQVDRRLQRDYYVQDLLPELADYYRGQLPPECHPTHLVTIASQSPELVILLAKVVQPRRCLLLFTADNRSLMEMALLGVQRLVKSCEVQPREFSKGVGMSEAIAGHVQCFTRSVSPSDILFDLTPGSKEMSLELALRVAPPGSHLFYLRHDTVDHSRAAIPEKRTPFIGIVKTEQWEGP